MLATLPEPADRHSWDFLSVFLISRKLEVSEHEQKRKLGFDFPESEVRMKRMLKELELRPQLDTWNGEFKACR